MKYGRHLDLAKTDSFVGMYVNDWTLDFGPRGREAVALLLRRGFEQGFIPRPGRVGIHWITQSCSPPSKSAWPATNW